MRIPTGNFGNVVAEPQRQAQVRSSGAVGQALGNVANAIGGVAQDMQDVERAQQQAKLQKQRAEAASTLATATNEAHDDYDDISRGVDEGRIKPEDAIPEFKKRFGERQGARNKALTEEQRLLIDDNMIRVSGTLERGLNGVVLKRMQAETDAAILNTGEQLQRRAMRDLDGAIRSWETVVDAVPHWDPVKKTQAKQQFREGAAYNVANAALERAAETGNVSVVRAARENLESEAGDVIDPARRTALITKAIGYEQGIAAAGVREQERLKREHEARENKGRDAYKDAQALVLNGRYLSTEYISELSAITAGTSAAPAVQELVRSQAAVAGFASLPLSQQTATIERRRAAGSTPGVGVSAEQEQMTAAMERIREGSIRAYAENPWTAAQERGVIARAPAIQLNDLAGAQAVLAERMKQIATVEAAAERKISPLQPQEAEQIGRLVRMLPPDQQSAALASFGTMIGDADRLAALALQIDTKDKVLGTAMMIGDLRTNLGRYVSELVLRGDRALRDKVIKPDGIAESGWRASIAKEIGEAYPNQEQRDRMIEAAYYIKAGLTADGTVKDGIENAVQLATGGIITHNGSKIPLPMGMKEDAFEKRLSSIKPVDLAAQAPGGKVIVGKTAVPLDQFVNSLPDATLVHAGQGRYNIRAGMGLVVNSQGKRITIEVRNGN